MHFFQDYWIVAKRVHRKKNTGKPRVLVTIIALLHSLLLLLELSVLWLFIVTFDNDAKPLPKWILRKFDVSRIQPRLRGLPPLKRLHGKIWSWLRELPSLVDQATRPGGSPHLSCKCDQIKMRDYRDRRVTPPERVTSPSWGPPPPCKQALNGSMNKDYTLL